MSMQSMLMALLGGQGQQRGFKDSIAPEQTEQERFGRHFEGEPWPYRKSGQRVKLQDDPTIDPADPNDQERQFNSRRLNMNEREPFSRGKNNFFETDESEYSDAEDSDILDYPRIFKTHQEPEYDEDESEDASILSNALKTVQSMRETRNKGNLGMFSKYDPSPEARKDRGYYQRMGKSLIQLMSPLTIRNEKEFNEMIQGLYDPDITDAEAEGVLNAAEDLIKQNLDIERSKGKKGSKGKKESKTTKKSTETKEEGIPKPPVTSFFK